MFRWGCCGWGGGRGRISLLSLIFGTTVAVVEVGDFVTHSFDILAAEVGEGGFDRSAKRIADDETEKGVARAGLVMVCSDSPLSYVVTYLVYFINRQGRWGRGGRDSLGGRLGCGGRLCGLSRC